MYGKSIMEEQGWMVQRLEKLQMDLKVIAGMRPYSAINYIRKGVAYEDYLREYAEVRRIPFEDLAVYWMNYRKMPEDLKRLTAGLNISSSCGKNWRNRQKTIKWERVST